MPATRTLEREALSYRASGTPWSAFWYRNAHAIREAAADDPQRLQRLVNRLLHLLTTGDTAGLQPVGDADTVPWEMDDAMVEG